jgi:hypothetical protein
MTLVILVGSVRSDRRGAIARGFVERRSKPLHRPRRIMHRSRMLNATLAKR